MDEMIKSKKGEIEIKEVENEDYVKYFQRIERKFNKLKAKHEE